MFMKSLAAALLGASLIAAPALAQSTDTKAPPAKAASAPLTGEQQ